MKDDIAISESTYTFGLSKRRITQYCAVWCILWHMRLGWSWCISTPAEKTANSPKEQCKEKVGDSVFLTMIRKKIDTWRYLGYSKEALAPYEEQIASDNLKILGGALVIAAISTACEIAAIYLFAISGEGLTDSLWVTVRLMVITIVAIAIMGVCYLLIRRKPNKVLYSRILTTVFLGLWSILYIVIGTRVDPEDYAVIACGLFLLIQVMFNAYPMENLLFVTCTYVLFVVMGLLNKPSMIFVYDMINSLPFLLMGLFLSWVKTRSKWAALINADAKVQLETQRLENELLQSRVSVMLSQIQPHFLYNTLTAISVLCDKNPTQARKATIEFSEYLRGNLDSLKQTMPIPFEKELEHIEIYLNLEKMRFADELNIVYDIQTTAFMLPALTVQPLIENAVKYGVGKAEDGGTVTLATRAYANHFEITVSDDGVGFDPYETQYDGRSHIGIDNVKGRLLSMSNATLEIISKKNVGTVVTIQLPRCEE